MSAETGSAHQPPCITSSRCIEAEIRRAAGSKSLTRLKAAVESGWTTHELDTSEAFTIQGKSALQMAAWKGSLENVQYLVEKVGCNVNAYSRSAFSYGKTPIFFAVTQTRPEIVEYLLSLPGIHVAIVNNKGQSVMSLAASHDMHHLLPRIRQLEEGQEWWNFRQSHSDGLEYGDLDPRFLARPLRDSDVVTQHAINPTTSQTRKGGFARRNPEAAKEKLRLRQEEEEHKQTTKPKRQGLSTPLSSQEEYEWKQAWIQFEGNPKSKETVAASSYIDDDYDSALLTIIRLGEKQRSAWMPNLVEHLSKTQSSPSTSIDDVDVIIRRTKALARQLENNDRLETLLDKLSCRLRSQDPSDKRTDETARISTDEQASSPSSPTNRKWKPSIRQAEDLLQSDLGQQVRRSVSTLSIRQGLEWDDSSILRLTMSPIFVNNITQIFGLQEELKQVSVVAIDTEWSTDSTADQSHGPPGVHVSTFQISFVTSNQHDNKTPAYVVDIKQCHAHEVSIDDEDDYWTLVRELIAWVLEDPCILVLGFSVGHDLPLLERFIGRKLQPAALLDLQVVLGKNHDQSGSSLPGLKACVAKFSQVPLSKTEQCSDWGQRPLSRSQLNYAGLDAVVLLFLLAEYNATTLK